MKKIALAVLMAAFIAGCQTTPDKAPVDDKSGTAAGTTAGTGSTGATTSGTQAGNLQGRMDPRKDPNSPLSKRSIYFEFDSFTVADQYKPVIEAHARYMQANRQAKVTLQGHADERGSREYNIALGQKRADAVKRMMQLMGVQETVIETVSFGKEKPRNMGHDEAAWAENRRVDIIYVDE
jgi:peptidoglycan-associated lipoprotein